MSPDETDREGVIRALRTGVTVSDDEVIAAVSHDPEEIYLPSTKRDRTGKLSGKGLISSEDMADLQNVLVSTVKETAAAMYSGCAHRTPSSDACKYCRLKDACGVHEGEQQKAY